MGKQYARGAKPVSSKSHKRSACLTHTPTGEMPSPCDSFSVGNGADVEGFWQHNSCSLSVKPALGGYRNNEMKARRETHAMSGWTWSVHRSSVSSQYGNPFVPYLPSGS